jgi:DNA (cytosine-5)-methyltransferase 1
MKYGSLFSGIGGFDIALNRAGFIPAWMCEIDKSCQNILERHFEGVKIYDDVRTIRNAEPVDLICGGFPCQDLSVAGKRAGLAGERSGLWFEFARVIDELEPKWVVIENVPGLLSSDRGADFAIIVRWLVERGYGVSWRILDAQYFGVPQRRRRVFIVGSFGNGRSAEVLFERESSTGDTAPSREKREETANDAPTSTLRGFGRQGQHNDTNPVIAQSTDGALQERDYKGVGSQYVNENKCVVANTIAGGSSKCHSDITSGQQDGNLIIAQLIGVRRLTPTECERLQGFEDGWTDGQHDSTRYRQLGNAVAVPVVEWIAKRIIRHGT